MRQPSRGTKAVIFRPFLISCTRTHLRMAELGCLASTPLEGSNTRCRLSARSRKPRTLFQAQCPSHAKRQRMGCFSSVCPSETSCSPCRAIVVHVDDLSVCALCEDHEVYLKSKTSTRNDVLQLEFRHSPTHCVKREFRNG